MSSIQRLGHSSGQLYPWVFHAPKVLLAEVPPQLVSGANYNVIKSDVTVIVTMGPLGPIRFNTTVNSFRSYFKHFKQSFTQYSKFHGSLNLFPHCT